jgi:hypothetical protein
VADSSQKKSLLKRKIKKINTKKKGKDKKKSVPVFPTLYHGIFPHK